MGSATSKKEKENKVNSTALNSSSFFLEIIQRKQKCHCSFLLLSNTVTLFPPSKGSLSRWMTASDPFNKNLAALTFKAPSTQTWHQRIADLLRELNISIVTSTDSAMVVGKRDSNTSQSMPSNMGFSSVHCMKCRCTWRERKREDVCNKYTCNFGCQRFAQKDKTAIYTDWTSYQLVERHLWALFIKQVPPHGGAHCSKSHISWSETLNRKETTVIRQENSFNFMIVQRVAK